MLIPPVLCAQEEFAVSGHPRLLMKAGEEAMVADMIARDPVMGRIHGAIVTECDLMLDLPPLVARGERD